MRVTINRILLATGFVLAIAAYPPKTASALDGEGDDSDPICSTCESNASTHWFVGNCCLPGSDFCMKTAPIYHTSPQGLWCGESHAECPAARP